MCLSFIKWRRITVKEEMGKNLNYSSLTGHMRFRKENILKLKPWELIVLNYPHPCNPCKVFPYSSLMAIRDQLPKCIHLFFLTLLK